MNAWVRRARGAVFIITCWLVASCASGPAPDVEPDLGPLRPVRSPADVTLPLDADRFTQREYLSVQRAAWRLTRDCVRRFGAEYTLAESVVTANLPRFEKDNARRYGLLDADSAAARGYNVPPAELPPPVDRSKSWNPTDAEKLLVRSAPGGMADVPKDTTGKPLPLGGCQGEADRILLTGTKQPPDDQIAEKLGIETFKRSGNDSRVQAVMARWSACMKRAGYTYQSIWEPNDKQWPDPATAEEIATAKADVACKKETNLAAIWMQVETAYQKKIIDERAQDLALARQFVQVTARNAARIVGGG